MKAKEKSVNILNKLPKEKSFKVMIPKY